MEQAFHRIAPLAQHREAARVYGLTQHLLALIYVWPGPAKDSFTVAAKGAPEAVAELCRLSASQADELLNQTRLMAQDGLRVLAIAVAEHSGPLPGDVHTFAFRLLGLAGLSDPVRDTVPAAVAECRAAGIRVVMVTGDYPETARAIAAQAG